MSEIKYYLDLLRKELVKEWRGEESSQKDEYETLKPEYGDEIKELTDHINENLLKYDKRLNEKKKKRENKRTWSVDSSTVERLFGYKDRDKWEGPSPITLSFLAKSLKYKSWGNFKSTMGETYSPHVPDVNEVFENQRKEILLVLERGIPNESGIYTLGWEPIKYSKLRYLGGFEFEVIESKNMHKKQGDMFITPDFKTCPTKGTELPDIKLDDYEGNVNGDGYFYDKMKEGEVFYDDYFYL